TYRDRRPLAMRPADEVAQVSVGLPFDEALVLHPEVVEQLRQVLVACIRGKRDHAFRSFLFLAVLEGRGQQGAGRRAGKYALFSEQLARGTERLGIADAVGLLHAAEVRNRRDEILADALDQPAALLAEFARVDVI